ncbi:hypothetical protein [Kribbella speibonae]|uniref:Uncharacterized protein n=1 Tax=Kribbella speibonae TaxID=1572660 RepID=A0A4R0IQD9_9ACTN|nr:hypothetical protein [Kribbella speibonae]TCC27166.1 hypothetical protein E0H58_04035 [Kribbella speibonae]TCC35981.1 hypothetical protein E0H92_25150 [Kribbella speibonae]
MTEPIVFEHDRVQIRVDRGIFELFERSNVIRSYRTPLEWVRVQAQVRKRGVILLHFSYVEDLDEPIYTRLMTSVCSLSTVEITMADEPVYRAFFTELAHLSGRPID